MTKAVADVGLVGLAVMGQNLVLNMADHGFIVAVYNRTTSVMEEFVAKNPPSVFGSRGGKLVAAAELREFVASIKRPRKIVILVKAGKPTDAVIDSLVPLLEKGDCIVDGGNAHWEDTERRERMLSEKGLLFVGSGVSGGEEGARFGPSLMPGGKKESWELIRPIWTSIAAKVDSKNGKPIEGARPGEPVSGGEPCAAYMGPGAAGHFVKMVHNGIEYGDMQMICEAYHLLSALGGLSAKDAGDIFAHWNEGDLDSFLIEITADILRQKDPTTGKPFVEVVLDAAGQKGTGMWTSVAALQMGVPAATVAEAVFARSMSALKEERVSASRLIKGPGGKPVGSLDSRLFGSKQAFVDAVGKALYCAKICSYAQGFQIMSSASREKEWNLNFGEIAMIWRGGCIIRARFLQRIKEAYDRNRSLANLLLDPYFSNVIGECQTAWRSVISAGALAGVPTPAFSSALSYFDSYRLETLPANLLQAQRDYFGAHTYERTDQPRGQFFHLEWSTRDRKQVKA